VYLELKRKWYEINTINTSNYEIDFIAEKDSQITYFQVSYTIKNSETYNREIKPLFLLKDNYKKVILTLDELETQDNWIEIKNIINWSLEEE